MKSILLLSILIFSCRAFSDEGVFSVIPLSEGAKFDCEFTWNEVNGKRYLPNEKFKYMSVAFIRKMDGLVFKTENYSSVYKYDSVLELKEDSYGISKGTIGMTYALRHSGNKINYLDVFSDGVVMLFSNNDSVSLIAKAECSDLSLNIGRG